jgi:uncharacterized protein YktA (UPF0223 family)
MGWDGMGWDGMERTSIITFFQKIKYCYKEEVSKYRQV